MISPLTAVTKQHRTPPAINGNILPSTPSSERLRAIAPSPITVIPRSKLRYSPSSPALDERTPPRRPPRPSVAQALSFSLRSQERAPSICSVGEDGISEIIQSYARLSNSHTDRGQSDGEGDIDVPIILDNGTRASENAISRHLDRTAVPQDIPEEVEDAEFLNVAPSAREDEENMTPGEFYRAHYKPQVMVRFNTHVFGAPAPGEANDENDNGPAEPESPGSHYDDDETSDRKASSSSSWYVPERRLTDFSDYNRDDVRHAAIEEEYEDNDSTPGVNTSTADPMAALPRAAVQAQGAPALDDREKTSPESFNTELITPAHDDVPLPIAPRGFSEQGVPRPHAHAHDGRHADPRFLPAKSSFRRSTAPVDPSVNVLAPAAITTLKRPKLIAPTPSNNTADGLQLDTTGRRSIDVDHERAIEHAGGTPGRPSRILEDRTTPPVPPLPKHLIKLPVQTEEVEDSDAEPSPQDPEEQRKLEISRLLDELEDPDIDPTPDTEAREDNGNLEESVSKPWPEDLARVNRNTTLELIVNQDSGVPVWCTLPIRRLSRPEFWQDKEDQALSKAIRWHDPPPKPQPFQQTGAVIFGQPPKRRTKWTFFYTSKSMPTLKGVMINDGTGKDHTRGKIKLNIKDEGVYEACGYDEDGRTEWMFQYLVTKRENTKSRRQKRARVSPPSFI